MTDIAERASLAVMRLHGAGDPESASLMAECRAEIEALRRVKNRPARVTQEAAESYDWWSDFLAARMVAIQAMLALGRSHDEIATQLGLEPGQDKALIYEAMKRQTRPEESDG